MASLTSDQIYEIYQTHFVEPMRKFREENPHLFEPIQIVVVDDDGTETDRPNEVEIL